MKKLACVVAFVVVAACSSDPETTPSPDAGGAGTNDGGGGSSGDGGVSGDGSGPGDGGGKTDAAASCTAAAEQLLKPVDTVSTGEVTVLSESAGIKTLFVDAAAGGAAGAATNPRLYVNLETTSRVAVTDKTATTSTEWDLAIKRPILFANSGDGGSGQGGAVLVAKDFDAVTMADTSGKTFAPESFF